MPPFILEVLVLFSACIKYKIINQVEEIQRGKENDAKHRQELKLKESEENVKKLEEQEKKANAKGKKEEVKAQ